MTTKYYKEPEFYKALGAEGAMASILDPKHHRMYRNHLRPLFASRAVDGIVPRLRIELQKASHICEQHRKHNRPLNIQALCRSFTVCLPLQRLGVSADDSTCNMLNETSRIWYASYCSAKLQTLLAMGMDTTRLSRHWTGLLRFPG